MTPSRSFPRTRQSLRGDRDEDMLPQDFGRLVEGFREVELKLHLPRAD